MLKTETRLIPELASDLITKDFPAKLATIINMIAMVENQDGEELDYNSYGPEYEELLHLEFTYNKTVQETIKKLMKRALKWEGSSK